jgi:hypothetical protein
MKYFKSLGLCLVAVFALGAVVASAAQAEANKGPLWIVGSPAKGLLTGETRAITSRTEAAPVLKGTVASVECVKARDHGFLLGGSPGTADVEIEFEGCTLQGKPNCEAKGLNPAGAAGEIPVSALITLAFAKGSRTSAVAVFATEASSNLFSEFEFKNKTGTECGALNGTSIPVKASGSAIKIKGQERKAGQIAEVGQENATTKKFELTTPGATAAIGLLRFSNEEKPVKEAELYNSEAGKEKYEEIKAELSAGALLGEVHEVASAEIEIPTLEPFGWNY